MTGGDLLRIKLTKTQLAEDRNRLAEQPAQVRDRHRLRVVLCEVLVDKLREDRTGEAVILSAETRTATQKGLDRRMLAP